MTDAHLPTDEPREHGTAADATGEPGAPLAAATSGAAHRPASRLALQEIVVDNGGGWSAGTRAALAERGTDG